MKTFIAITLLVTLFATGVLKQNLVTVHPQAITDKAKFLSCYKAEFDKQELMPYEAKSKCKRLVLETKIKQAWLDHDYDRVKELTQ